MSAQPPHHTAAAYLKAITEAAQEQSREAGKPWPDVLRIPQPMNFEEAEALRCWLQAAERERGAPVRVAYLWTH